MIDRGFVRLAAGQLHYRAAGAADLPCLVLAHGGPGSSAGLAPLIEALSSRYRVIAPDMMGNGDSDSPPSEETEIGFYAECVVRLLDALEIGEVHFYGTHTGAQVGVEFAIAEPGRIRRLVLDGVALFPDDLRREFLARYAPPVLPREDGLHLAKAWEFCSQLTRHFPWYRQDEAHRVVPETILPADAVMGIAMDMLKSWRTYHIAYGAAFRHDLPARLPLVTAPTLVLDIADDPLPVYSAEVAALLPHGQAVSAARSERGAAILSFLDQA